ncbi:hypothetical protein PFISCL1PPCAC_20193 [Pristionchus fissidentatus]|uniref:Uncharacterized protein n=1 Tax=Pristionchus fissidentatus TaxID=1538716 RepID=A0AAV5WDF1_9BILA|nr:hypothetical protein PFISCL1PPCAC_20193 [Pristionchus fissidentatus]
MEYRCSLSAGNSVLDREVELYRENEGLKREMEHMRRIMESMDCHHAENGNLQSRFNWAMNELENERTRSKNALYVASGDSVRDKGRISELNRKLCDFERRERVWKEEKEKLTMKITIAQGMTTNTTNCHSNSIEPEVTVIDGPEEARVLHPLDIFQPCKNSKDSMPADVAFSRLRTKHELECNRVKFHRMMLPFINKKLCPVCGISLGDVGHLLGKKHLNKIKAYGGRVSKSAFEYWMKKMDESLMKKKIGATASVQAVVSAAKEVSTTNDKREKTLTTVVKKASTPSAAAVANKAIVQQVITPSVTQLKQKTLSKSLSHILNCGSENHVNEVNIRVALSSLCDKWDSSVRKSEIRRETKGLMMLCDSCDTNALNVDALMEHLKEENHINKMIQTKTKVCTEAVSEWMEMMKE